MADADNIVVALVLDGVDKIKSDLQAVASAVSTTFSNVHESLAGVSEQLTAVSTNIQSTAQTTDEVSKHVESSGDKAEGFGAKLSEAGHKGEEAFKGVNAAVQSTVGALNTLSAEGTLSALEGLGEGVEAVTSQFGTFGRILGLTAIGATTVGVAFGAATYGLLEFGRAGGEAAQEIVQLAHMTGSSVEQILALQDTMTKAGISAGNMAQMFRIMSIRIQAVWPDIVRDARDAADNLAKNDLAIAAASQGVVTAKIKEAESVVSAAEASRSVLSAQDAVTEATIKAREAAIDYAGSQDKLAQAAITVRQAQFGVIDAYRDVEHQQQDAHSAATSVAEAEYNLSLAQGGRKDAQLEKTFKIQHAEEALAQARQRQAEVQENAQKKQAAFEEAQIHLRDAERARDKATLDQKTSQLQYQAAQRAPATAEANYAKAILAEATANLEKTAAIDGVRKATIDLTDAQNKEHDDFEHSSTAVADQLNGFRKNINLTQVNSETLFKAMLKGWHDQAGAAADAVPTAIQGIDALAKYYKKLSAEQRQSVERLAFGRNATPEEDEFIAELNRRGESLDQALKDASPDFAKQARDVKKAADAYKELNAASGTFQSDLNAMLRPIQTDFMKGFTGSFKEFGETLKLNGPDIEKFGHEIAVNIVPVIQSVLALLTGNTPRMPFFKHLADDVQLVTGHIKELAEVLAALFAIDLGAGLLKKIGTIGTAVSDAAKLAREANVARPGSIPGLPEGRIPPVVPVPPVPATGIGALLAELTAGFVRLLPAISRFGIALTLLDLGIRGAVTADKNTGALAEENRARQRIDTEAASAGQELAAAKSGYDPKEIAKREALIAAHPERAHDQTDRENFPDVVRAEERLAEVARARAASEARVKAINDRITGPARVAEAVAKRADEEKTGAALLKGAMTPREETPAEAPGPDKTYGALTEGLASTHGSAPGAPPPTVVQPKPEDVTAGHRQFQIMRGGQITTYDAVTGKEVSHAGTASTAPESPQALLDEAKHAPTATEISRQHEAAPAPPGTHQVQIVRNGQLETINVEGPTPPAPAARAPQASVGDQGDVGPAGPPGAVTPASAPPPPSHRVIEVNRGGKIVAVDADTGAPVSAAPAQSIIPAAITAPASVSPPGRPEQLEKSATAQRQATASSEASVSSSSAVERSTDRIATNTDRVVTAVERATVEKIAPAPGTAPLGSRLETGQGAAPAGLIEGRISAAEASLPAPKAADALAQIATIAAERQPAAPIVQPSAAVASPAAASARIEHIVVAADRLGIASTSLTTASTAITSAETKESDAATGLKSTVGNFAASISAFSTAVVALRTAADKLAGGKKGDEGAPKDDGTAAASGGGGSGGSGGAGGGGAAPSGGGEGVDTGVPVSNVVPAVARPTTAPPSVATPTAAPATAAAQDGGALQPRVTLEGRAAPTSASGAPAASGGTPATVSQPGASAAQTGAFAPSLGASGGESGAGGEASAIAVGGAGLGGVSTMATPGSGVLPPAGAPIPDFLKQLSPEDYERDPTGRTVPSYPFREGQTPYQINTVLGGAPMSYLGENMDAAIDKGEAIAEKKLQQEYKRDPFKFQQDSEKPPKPNPIFPSPFADQTYAQRVKGTMHDEDGNQIAVDRELPPDYSINTQPGAQPVGFTPSEGYGYAGNSGDTVDPGFATGGHIQGPGSTTSDSIPIMASHNEFVMQSKATEHWGVDFMHAINEGRIPAMFNGGILGDRDAGAAALPFSSMFAPPREEGASFKGFAMGGVIDGFAAAFSHPLIPDAPKFAGGGSVPSGSSMRPLTLVIGDQKFGGLMAPEKTAGDMTKFAINQQLTSTSRNSPSWRR